jgi:hypothetical protein
VILSDVVLLGVLVGDWTLFSPNRFPCCLYNSVVPCYVKFSCNRLNIQLVSMSNIVERPLDVVIDSTYNQLSITTDTNVKCKKS